MPASKGLLERLQAGEHLVMAEGYLFCFERRCYLKAGHFVPEVVLEHPDLLKAQYEEFAHAGSDVVLAFTYYAHREKLSLIGKADLLEEMNRKSLKLAREVADATGTMMAGNICNTNCWMPNDPKQDEKIYNMFKEQIELAVQEGADFILAETFPEYGEAKIALKAIKDHGKGLPSVVSLMVLEGLVTGDGLDAIEVLKLLKKDGADVVGLNCSFGPDNMLTAIKKVRKAIEGPIFCLPVPYRTTEKTPHMQDLTDHVTGKRAFPYDLDAWLCSRSHIAQFTRELVDVGVQFMGLCCGNSAGATRAMAEALGHTPPGSKYSPDMSQHLSQVKGSDKSQTTELWHRLHDKHIGET